jgi:hypothetical protein
MHFRLREGSQVALPQVECRKAGAKPNSCLEC